MTAANANATRTQNAARWTEGREQARQDLLAGRAAALSLTVVTKAGVVAQGYGLTQHRSEEGWLVGYRLTKRDGTHYDLELMHGGSLSCDCPSANYRPGACKHARGLKAALAVLDLPADF